jgi:hypothetical protein
MLRVRYSILESTAHITTDTAPVMHTETNYERGRLGPMRCMLW